MRPLGLLLLCISFNASALNISFSGQSQVGTFEVVDGRVIAFSATVGTCPEIGVDPETGVSSDDCLMHVMPEEGFFFNDVLGVFFTGIENLTATVRSPGHSTLYLSEDGTYRHTIAVPDRVDYFGTYQVSELPEPDSLALLPLAWLAFSARRRAPRIP
ncbi:MAG: hypothetical protein IT532_01180 [Burkholderiales bacterium]|nr:hypothetical protein [Burkholderiales bacterium]